MRYTNATKTLRYMIYIRPSRIDGNSTDAINTLLNSMNMEPKLAKTV